MTDEMPPDPEFEAELGAGLAEAGHTQTLKTWAFHLHRGLVELAEAAAITGHDPSRLREMTVWAEGLNRHFNPTDLGRLAGRLQHGTTKGPPDG